jgi:hypothetical protein
VTTTDSTTTTDTPEPLLSVKDLRVEFRKGRQVVSSGCRHQLRHLRG